MGKIVKHANQCEYTHTFPQNTSSNKKIFNHSDKCAPGQTNVPTQYTFLNIHTFSRDMLSPRVNLLSEIHIYQHTLSGCHREKSQDDSGIFLSYMAC